MRMASQILASRPVIGRRRASSVLGIILTPAPFGRRRFPSEGKPFIQVIGYRPSGDRELPVSRPTENRDD
jgi:hypothetical protein